MNCISNISNVKIYNQKTGELIMSVDNPQLEIKDEDGIHLYNQSAVDLLGNEFMVDEFRAKE